MARHLSAAPSACPVVCAHNTEVRQRAIRASRTIRAELWDGTRAQMSDPSASFTSKLRNSRRFSMIALRCGGALGCNTAYGVAARCTVMKRVVMRCRTAHRGPCPHDFPLGFGISWPGLGRPARMGQLRLKPLRASARRGARESSRRRAHAEPASVRRDRQGGAAEVAPHLRERALERRPRWLQDRHV